MQVDFCVFQHRRFEARSCKVLFTERSVKIIDGSKKWNRQLAFELQLTFAKSAVTLARRNNAKGNTSGIQNLFQGRF